MWCTMTEFTTQTDAGCTHPSNENWCLFLSSACDERDVHSQMMTGPPEGHAA